MKTNKNKKTIRLRFSVVGAALISTLSALIITTGVVNSASFSAESFYKKLIANDAAACYSSALKDTVKASDFKNFSSMMASGHGKKKVEVRLPSIDSSSNKMSAKLGDGSRGTSCYAVFDGDGTALGTLSGNMKGLFDLYGVSVPSQGDYDGISDFMKKMGYSEDTAKSGKKQYCYRLYTKGTDQKKTDLGKSKCINEDNYGETGLAPKDFNTFKEKGDVSSVEVGAHVVGSGSYAVHDGLEVRVNAGGPYDCGNSSGASYCTYIATIPDGIPKIGTTQLELKPGLTGKGSRDGIYLEITEKQDAGGSENAVYKRGPHGETAVKNITGAGRKAFSDLEKYNLYTQYLKNYYGFTKVSTKGCKKSKPSALANASKNEYYVYSPGNGWCLGDFDINKVGEKHVMEVFGNGENYVLNSSVDTLPKLLQIMGSYLSTSALDTQKATADAEDAEAENNKDGGACDKDDKSEKCKQEKEEEACFQQSGALGWIICPIIFGTKKAVSSLYSIVEPYLQVNGAIVNEIADGTQGSGSIIGPWTMFRNIANIAFVIIFLLVILSQVTGYGIDNYGIKRMLPRLIVAAILVNLSFIICALAVDISNIIGSSISNFLIKYAPPIDNKEIGNASNSHLGAYVVDGLIGVVISLLVVLKEGWAVVIPILLFLLTVAIAIAFAFIVLGIRQAIVILLIVVSPLAFVCYVLPNLKSVFDKWYKLFKDTLMVYPICGALIGGGYFASHILYNVALRDNQGDNLTKLLMTILAGALCVVPYFFIPSITKKAVDGVANLGTMVSGFGSTLGKKATKAIGNSGAVSGARENSREAMAGFRSGVYLRARGEKNAEKLRNGTLSRGAAKRYTNALKARTTKMNESIAARSAQGQYNRLMSNGGFDAAMASASMAENEAATKNYETMLKYGSFGMTGDSAVDNDGRILDNDGNPIQWTDKDGKPVYFSNKEDAKNGLTNKINPQSIKGMGAALREELLKGDGADVSKIQALQNALNGKGDKGRTEIAKALTTAKTQAAQSGGKKQISSNAIKAFSSNIANNPGDYKNKYRSLFDYANQTAESGDTSIDYNQAAGAGSLTPTTFLQTDKAQMDAYVAAYNNGSMSESDRANLSKVAHNIANNSNLNGNIKIKDYDEALNTFASDVNWNNVYSGNSSEVKIDHSNDIEPAAAAEQSQPRVTRLETPSTGNMGAAGPTANPQLNYEYHNAETLDSGLVVPHNVAERIRNEQGQNNNPPAPGSQNSNNA